MNYNLPDNYRARGDSIEYLDIPSDVIYQPHVYELLIFLARRAGVRRIIDIGCGSAKKLIPLQHDFDLICIDNTNALALARQVVPTATFLEWNLEFGLPDIIDNFIDDSIIVCADVIEHLSNPVPLANALAQLQPRCHYQLISTPDRTRARGLLDKGPPSNPAHVREWSADEFGCFLIDCGFPRRILIGHTINTDIHCAKITTLAIAGREGIWPIKESRLRIAAVINVFNEIDILSEVVEHLVRQGVEVHLVDNWSTDGSFELAQSLKENGLCHRVLRYPESPSNEYEWAKLLHHTSSYAASLDADWIIHHDADEIRSCPWDGVTLAEALTHVDNLGYNAVDFTVLNFRYLLSDKNQKAPYEMSLNWFEFGRRPGHFMQIKAWKNSGYSVDLETSGGHEAIFESRRVYPLKFLLKHYPLRYPSQACRKVFNERFPRIEDERVQRGWHTQYDEFRGQHDVPGWEKRDLLPWHAHFFNSEYLVERLSGIGINK